MRSVVVLFVAVALAACASHPDAHVCTTGIVCPVPTQCAAVQPVCITNNCGNGIVDPGEACDDGNILPGDGCSPTCQTEKCGNGVIDPGEICDLGAANGQCQGCSADCKSNETCGNNTVDRECGEVCDDGNTVGGDGCSATCKSTEVCGNGIVDTEVGEVCDPPGAGCSANCRSVLMCGNGIVDPGEECDNGLANNNNNADCRADCVLNRCGDGFVNSTGTHHEDCDAAAPAAANSRVAIPVESAGCNLDCTAAICNDGKINRAAGEQCDDGAANSNTADCTALCKLNICGDGLKDSVGPAHIEACDDGNQIDNDGCSNSCTLPSCGNSIVDLGEECDLGAGNNGPTSACPACHIARCGDNHVETGVEQCDPGTPGVDTASCNRDCTTPSCGDSKVNHNFVPSGAPGGEQCDPPNAAQGCSTTCQLAHCGNGVVDSGEGCDNGAANSINGPCLPWCQPATCGDGLVESSSNSTPATEQCDRGTANGATICPYGTQACSVCTSNCQNAAGTTSFCGDGTVDGAHGELCDPGTVDVDTATCNHDCTVPSCGDGKVNHSFTPTGAPGPEQCDPPNAATGCSTKCQLVHCGNGVIDLGEGCDNGAANNLNGPCLPWCQLATCGDGRVESSSNSTPPTEQCDKGTANGTTACPYGALSCSVCNSNCQNAAGTTAYCGDGVTNGAEACDNGAANGTQCAYLGGSGHTSNNCSTCSATCGNTTSSGPFCGDGVVSNGEVCDQGSGLNGTPCPYGTSCNRCNASCTVLTISQAGPMCGDGVVNAPIENCDDSGATQTKIACPYGTATCTACHSCTTVNLVGPFCGDNSIQLGNGETCELPNTSTCNAICQAVTCTDGFKDGAETDVDCGGATCDGSGHTCANGKVCAVGADCTSVSCSGGLCVAPTCTDLVRNGLETDVDCGGTTCDGLGFTCANGKLCGVAADCASRVCTAGTCAAPTCTDLVRNGTETDVDCGGATCAACAMGKACLVPTDCASNSCIGNVCQ